MSVTRDGLHIQAYDLEKQDRPYPFRPYDNSSQHSHDTDNPPDDQNVSPTSKRVKQSVYNAPPVRDIDPAADRLAEDPTPLSAEDFYTLIGLNAPTPGKDGLGQIAKPHGLYGKLYRNEKFTNRKYHAFDFTAYILLFLQLVISAVFIILGSLPHLDTHIPIAVLGAIATVIAGALALMKGNGLPNRLRVERDELRLVMFEVEELYWDIRSGRDVLYKDVKKVREDFLRVMKAMADHHPDAVSLPKGVGAEGGGGGGSGGVRTLPSQPVGGKK